LLQTNWKLNALFNYVLGLSQIGIVSINQWNISELAKLFSLSILLNIIIVITLLNMCLCKSLLLIQ